MPVSTTQETLPSDVAAEVIVNAANASFASILGTETKNLTASDKDTLNVSDGISPATLKAAGIEAGISEEALNAELAKVAKKAAIYTRMQSRRSELGLHHDANQTILADEIQLSSYCKALLDNIDEIVLAITDRGALIVGLDTEHHVIQDYDLGLAPIELNHAPYKNQRSQWSLLKRFLLPFSGRKPSEETVTSPALSNLIDHVQALGLGVRIINDCWKRIGIVPQPGFSVIKYY